MPIAIAAHRNRAHARRENLKRTGRVAGCRNGKTDLDLTNRELPSTEVSALG
jgi:hypothetical protein